VRSIWDFDLNDDTPDDLSYGSGRTRMFRCPKGHPPWPARIQAITTQIRLWGSSGCPYCSHKLVVPGETDLGTTRPDLLVEWHPTKNAKLRPTDVFANSHIDVWWRCQSCSHSWRATPNSRTSSGSGCPACQHRVPAKGRTFADVVRIRPGEWSKSNARRPREFSPQSNEPVLRICLDCREEYSLRIQQWTFGYRHRCGLGSPRLVLLGEVAEMIGRSRSGTATLVKTEPSFPRPAVSTVRGRAWRRDDVELWVRLVGNARRSPGARRAAS
jgi:DNA-directed RNA polymerase subunit RPC12/RpoP/predicted DNA-binding transcriptional regulator AlpA